MGKILVIDDEPSIRTTLGNILEDEGHSVETAGSAEEGLQMYRKGMFDLLMLDVWLPGADGLSLLEQISSRKGAPPVIVISGHGTIETAVRATRLGAYDFLEKPLSLDRVILTVQHALSTRKLRDRVAHLQQNLSLDEVLIGESAPVRKLREQMHAAAPTSSRVLITGENGSGKEVVARTLHRESKRSDEPFIDVNCAAIPEELIESELFGHRKGSFTGAIEDRKGKFELADGGTLFLDEIGDMSLKTQAKVLRVLQEQEFLRIGGQDVIRTDVRVIAATNKNLEKEIEEGRFRQDLYFRVNVVPLQVPPLRDRGDDIVLLARHFLERFAAETGQRPKTLTSDAIDALKRHSWPGNVRELRNLIERLTILVPASEIRARDLDLGSMRSALSPSSVDGLTLRDARDRFEREMIEARLGLHDGNVSKTAESLGLERTHLYRKMSQLGISTDRFRQE
ncbi:MAG: sigma-54 dependent transcriptional regulator [Acidobacteria bacterium]|nr:sigma-54 dependent transcriptional regulator [Acidobacteriota bacterium]